MISTKLKPLIEELYENPQVFDFDQILTIIRIANSDYNEVVPKSTLPQSTPYQFVQRYHLSPNLPINIKAKIYFNFTGSDISNLTKAREKENSGKDTPTLEVNFAGIAGVQGALPLHDSEHFLDQINHRDYGGRDFLDIFNHRLLSLLHCVRRKIILSLGHQKAINTPLGQCLGDFIGFHYIYHNNYLAHQVPGLIYYAGALWHRRPPSLSELKNIIGHFLGMPVKIQSFIGGWVPLPPELQSIIGGAKIPAKNNILGHDLVLGRKVWQQNHCIKICLFNLTPEVFIDFLPPNQGYKALQKFLSYLWRKKVVINLEFSKNMPLVKLNKKDKFYLGWNTVLKSRTWSQPPKGGVNFASNAT